MKELSDQLITRIVERFSALADEQRIRLLLRLRQGECNVSTLTAELGLAQASVSKHLTVLRRAGLVSARREGTQAIYRVHDPAIFNLCQLVCDGVLRHLQQEHEALNPDEQARVGRVAASGKNRKKGEPS